MKIIYYALLAITIAACVDDHLVQPTKEFSIEVIDKVPFCPLTIIEFQSKDLKDLEKITGQIGELRCQTHNLPENFNQKGQKLIVTIRLTKPEETFACITLGPSFPYPLVTILDVVEK